MIFGFRCPICLQVGRRYCTSCLTGLPRAGAIRPPGGVVSAGALLAYDAAVQQLVLAAKNGNRRDLLRWAGNELFESGTIASIVTSRQFDVVTWMPASSDGLRRRGYDQGQILALVVAKRLNLRCQRLVVRRSGRSQIGLSRLERLAGPALKAVCAAPARVLVVDDVVTTGGSVAALASAIRDAGAEEVHLVAVASVDRF